MEYDGAIIKMTLRVWGTLHVRSVIFFQGERI